MSVKEIIELLNDSNVQKHLEDSLKEKYDLDYEGVDVYYYQSIGIDFDVQKVLDVLKEEAFIKSRNDYKNRISDVF